MKCSPLNVFKHTNSKINNWYQHNYITESTKLQCEVTCSFQNDPHTHKSFPHPDCLMCKWLVSTFLVSFPSYMGIWFIESLFKVKRDYRKEIGLIFLSAVGLRYQLYTAESFLI